MLKLTVTSVPAAMLPVPVTVDWTTPCSAVTISLDVRAELVGAPISVHREHGDDDRHDPQRVEKPGPRWSIPAAVHGSGNPLPGGGQADRAVSMRRSRCLSVVAPPVSALRKRSCGPLRNDRDAHLRKRRQLDSDLEPAGRRRLGSRSCRRAPRPPSARSKARGRTRRRRDPGAGTARSASRRRRGRSGARRWRRSGSTRPPTVRVETRRYPPGSLCWMPLSTRFAIIRSSSAGSPRVQAGSRSSRTSTSASLARARRSVMQSAASAARSAGSSRPVAASLRASISSPSISRSHRSTVSRTASPIRRSSSTVASGSASDTSTSVRMIASGVRSSCEALATKCRWLRERPVEPGEHPVERVGQLLELVGRALQADPLAQVLARHPARGRGDVAERTQRASRQQPAGRHRDDRHRAERDHVLDQQPVQRFGCAAGPGRPRRSVRRSSPGRTRAGVRTNAWRQQPEPDAARRGSPRRWFRLWRTSS